MHEGKLTRGQLQAWALNRYYYQSIIPIKDSIILSRSEDPAFRRAWRKRIVDHDGDGTRPGGIEKWIQLAQSTGSPRETVIAERGILPGRSLCGERIHRSGFKTQLSSKPWPPRSPKCSRAISSRSAWIVCAIIIPGSPAAWLISTRDSPRLPKTRNSRLPM